MSCMGYNSLCGSSHESSVGYNHSYFSGLTRSLSHVNHWGYNPQKRFVGSSPPSRDLCGEKNMLQPTIAGSMDTQWIHLKPKPLTS